MPVIVSGSLFGLRGGLLAGLTTPFLNTFLLNLAGHPGWDASLRETGGRGPLIVIVIGAVVGRWRDLSQALRRSVVAHGQVSEALRASEARCRQIFETNQAIVALVDPVNGRIVQANAAASRFYGHDQATLTTLRIQDINTQSEAEMARPAAAQRLVNARRVAAMEFLAAAVVCDTNVMLRNLAPMEVRVYYAGKHMGDLHTIAMRKYLCWEGLAEPAI